MQSWWAREIVTTATKRGGGDEDAVSRVVVDLPSRRDTHNVQSSCLFFRHQDGTTIQD